ncbi:MAG: ATP phosphoribosyltransferase [Devosiaceae bacterium]|nr:ATP phosphoribosyltransferase [Devosiaceae bacterium MH13]
MSAKAAKQSGEALVLGVPSKGRLQEATIAYFERAGLKITKRGGARDYRGQIAGLDGVDVAFLSASEIASELAAGTVHIGVTGMDLVHEKLPDPDGQTITITPLGFGHADVVVAVPDSWIDVRTMDDLEDVAAGFRAVHKRPMRLATKYVRLARRHFRQHGVVDYQIVESLGATEGAPASGAADLIVDITTTGATLTANHLRVLDGDDGTILRSQASLVASRQANWTDSARSHLRAILSRIASQDRAASIYEVRVVIADQAKTARQAADAFDCSAPFGAVAGQGQLVLHVARAQVWELVSFLEERGAGTVTVGELTYVSDPAAEQFSGVLQALSAG